MMTSDDLKSIWDGLNKDNNTYRLVDRHHPVDINIGYRDYKYRSLIILNAKKVSSCPSSKAILVQNYECEDGKWILSFTLVEDDKDEVYIKLCWDIIESSRTYTGQDVSNFILSRFLLWQDLMMYLTGGNLSIIRQKGLIGELLYLQKLTKTIGIDKAIASWSGPNWSDRDFVYDDTWAEIKTVKVSADVVSISSIEQLDSEDIGRLVVYFIDSTTPDDSNGFTLNMVVNKTQIMMESDPQSLIDFKRKLFAYGYSENPEYDSHYFVLKREKIYLVSDGFPRIIREKTSQDITWVKYGLSLAAIDKFEEKQ